MNDLKIVFMILILLVYCGFIVESCRIKLRAKCSVPSFIGLGGARFR